MLDLQNKLQLVGWGNIKNYKNKGTKTQRHEFVFQNTEYATSMITQAVQKKLD